MGQRQRFRRKSTLFPRDSQDLMRCSVPIRVHTAHPRSTPTRKGRFLDGVSRARLNERRHTQNLRRPDERLRRGTHRPYRVFETGFLPGIKIGFASSPQGLDDMQQYFSDLVAACGTVRRQTCRDSLGGQALLRLARALDLSSKFILENPRSHGVTQMKRWFDCLYRADAIRPASKEKCLAADCLRAFVPSTLCPLHAESTLSRAEEVISNQPGSQEAGLLRDLVRQIRETSLSQEGMDLVTEIICIWLANSDASSFCRKALEEPHVQYHRSVGSTELTSRAVPRDLRGLEWHSCG